LGQKSRANNTSARPDSYLPENQQNGIPFLLQTWTLKYSLVEHGEYPFLNVDFIIPQAGGLSIIPNHGVCSDLGANSQNTP